LKIIEGYDYRASGKANDVWIGEASITGENTDLRATIDYLLTGVFEYFGKDTKKQVFVDIKDDDPRLNALHPR